MLILRQFLNQGPFESWCFFKFALVVTCVCPFEIAEAHVMEEGKG